MPNRSWLIINSVDYLDDMFVKQNAYNTKMSSLEAEFSIMGHQSVIFMDTFHKDYTATRKALSAAFFKKKLQAITKVIKQVVIEFITEVQNSGVKEVDLTDFFR